jgi:hypothetical protein
MQPVRWDALAKHISAAVARVEEPAQSYRLVPRSAPGLLALAASLLIASGIGIHIYLSTRQNGVSNTPMVAIAKPVQIVTGPVAEAAPNGGMAEVSIGPAPQVAGNSDVSHYSSDLVTRQARLVIASGINPPTSTDASSLPY